MSLVHGNGIQVSPHTRFGCLIRNLKQEGQDGPIALT